MHAANHAVFGELARYGSEPFKFGHIILPTGFQHQNIHHCNLCCACKISAVQGSPLLI